MAFLNLCLLAFLFTLANCDHPDVKDPNDSQTRVRVNVPNPFTDLVPNLGRMFENIERNFVPPEEKPKPLFSDDVDSTVSPQLQRVRDNYKSLREFVHSALNLGRRGMNTNGLFSLDLKNEGANTNLNVKTPLGQVQMKAKSPTESGVTSAPNEDSSQSQTSTEVPVGEYMNNLVQQSINRIGERFGDFSLSLTDRSGNRIASIRRSGNSNRQVPEGSVRQTDLNSIRRSGYLPPEHELDDSAYFDTESDSEEYHHDPENGHGYYLDPNSWQYEEPSFHGRSVGNFETDSPYQREVYRPQPFSKSRDPVRKLTEHYYKLSTGKADETEDDYAYDDYIEDLEQVTGVLKEDSKEQLKEAFKQFRKSLENIDFGDNFDIKKLIDEPEDIHAWVPGGIVDQKDLEIAFLNIDKGEQPTVGDRMILAFTLTGTPLKIYMDSDIKNPLRHLHKRLTEAGVTLNVPVKSFNTMEPIGGEVLYVGANNQGRFVSRAMSIIVPKADNIKDYVSRYSKPIEIHSEPTEHEELKKAIQKSASSEEGKSFTDVLAENLKKRPDQVVADIVGFLGQSPFTTDSSLEESTEEVSEEFGEPQTEDPSEPQSEEFVVETE